MNNLRHQKHNSEKGQVLIIGAAILFCLALVFLLYLSIQRAYNLANFLDETAELAAQSAAEPVADKIVNGSITVDETAAENKAIATILFSAQSISPEIDPATITHPVTTINPGVSDIDICPKYNDASVSNPDICRFPVIVVDLGLPHRLMGIDFTIRSRGVATLGGNSRQPDTTESITPPTPTITLTREPIIIGVTPSP